MKKLLLGATVLAGAIGMSTASKAECGTITIADMNWQSAEFIAYVDQFILANGYGCDVELVPGDTMPTGTSMAEKGEPDIAPELWINALREVLDAQVEAGKLEYAGKSLSDGGEEGFWVPKYMVEKHPEMATIEGVLKHPELFPNPEDDSRGLFMGCPSGWNCQITSGNLFNAFNMEDKGWDLGDPGSSAGLNGSMAKAYEQGLGWFGYYWAPTAFLGKYEMVKVDFGVPHDKAEWDSCTVIPECENPKPNAWVESEVFTVTTAGFKDKSPEAYGYVSNRSFTNSFMNKFLKWMDENQASGEEAAEEFLTNYEAEWTPWVTKDVADKVKAAL
ncbi:ABC transporter substrate-binding protein [Curvivirga aplysinae]|uniref:ABC transporter substrate-binding protein n=1 Tax=Curvivirga aplysinae TaxID=2529852 RepID=UPI0012BCDABB|nr:ABC transporter substrate-binding protein [Curvivirga aplysinae]MTI08961.1 ABC transporter substrate-binding protein [Curvivirga aplysinae]